MILDIHTHMGVVPGNFTMPPEMQLAAMERYGIDYALISDIRCGESQTCGDGQTDLQVQINTEAAAFVRRHRRRLGLLLWCRPNAERGYTEEFEQLFLREKDIVKGLKIHPDISGLPFDDEKVVPYLEMAGRYGLPVLVHTQETAFSSCRRVAKVADRFPDVKLIMGHLSLSGDKQYPFELLRAYENLYGDTAWVRFDDVERACALGLENKLLFGTDSPIAGADTYADPVYYAPYFVRAADYGVALEQILYRNAVQLFGMEITRKNTEEETA